MIQETKTHVIQGAERKRVVDALGLEIPKKFQTLPYLGGRNTEGIALVTNPLINPEKLLRGSQMNAGHVPLEVAKMMEGKTFRSFNDFRREFWKNMAKSQYARQFSEPDFKRMLKGNPPIAALEQSLGKRISYELHHITPLYKGGGAYDLSNIIITTPRFHLEILEKRTHFGSF